ncbi:MAG: hypothetical protein SFY69_01955 [Planctomycetota bacterium]|nr:hypothetical protein [Planctomycetota bacterium]
MDVPSTPPDGPTTPPLPAPTGQVVCRRCGFSLAGLHPTLPCPECALPIERSLRGARLADASPEYLAWTSRGALLVFWAGIAVFFVVVAELSILISREFDATFPRWVDFAGAIVDISLDILNIIGWWWLSAPDPAYEHSEPATGLRRFLRATLGALLLVSIFDIVRTTSPTSFDPAFEDISEIAWFVFGAVSYFPSMLYLKRLALRVPDERLARLCARMVWLGPLLMTVGIIVLFLGPVAALIIMLVVQWRIYRHLRAALLEARAATPA